MSSAESAPAVFQYPGTQYKIRRGEKGGLYIRGPHRNVIYLKSTTVPDDLKALNPHLYDESGLLRASVRRQFDDYWNVKKRGDGSMFDGGSGGGGGGDTDSKSECDGRLGMCERRSAQLTSELVVVTQHLETQRSRENDYKSTIKKMEEERKFATDENKYLTTLLDTADRTIKLGKEHTSRRVAELEARVAELVSERDYLIAQQQEENDAVQKHTNPKSGGRASRNGVIVGRRGGGGGEGGDGSTTLRKDEVKVSKLGGRRSKSVGGSARKGEEVMSVLAKQIQDLETTLSETRAQLVHAQAASDDQRDKIHVAHEETRRLRERLAEAQRRITGLETDLKQAKSDYAESERKYKVATNALAAFQKKTPPPNSNDEDRVIENLRRKVQELGAKNQADLQILQQTSAERDRALQEKARLQRDNDVIRIVLDAQRPASTSTNRAFSTPTFPTTNTTGSSKRNLSSAK
jgi:chromosome segregation ATPase